MSEVINPSDSSVKLSQGAINAIRTLLQQPGYTRDFGDFYDAGRALSTLPKGVFLPKDTPDSQVDMAMKELVNVAMDEKTRDVIKLAMRHYINQKKEPYREFFELITALRIEVSR